MKKLIIFTVLVLALASESAVNAQKIDAMGTGFAISENLIVTNHHVINDAEKIYVRGINGNLEERTECKLLKSDADNDIAILEIIDVNKKIAKLPYGFETITCNQGEWICVIGFPQTSFIDESETFNHGSVTACKGYATPNNKDNSFTFDTPIQSGHSGSPIFNKFGDIIGIVSSGSRDNSSGIFQNFNSGIKTKTLAPMLNRLGKDLNLNAKKNKNFERMPNEEKFNRLKKFVYIIDIQQKKSYYWDDDDYEDDYDDYDDYDIDDWLTDSYTSNYDYLLHNYPWLENTYEQYQKHALPYFERNELKGKISKLTYRNFKYVDKFTGIQKQTIDTAWICTFDKNGNMILEKCYDKDDDLLYMRTINADNVWEIRNANNELLWKQIISVAPPVIVQQSIYYNSYLYDSIVVSKSECYLNEDGNCREFLQYNSQGLLYKTITVKYDNHKNIIEEIKSDTKNNLVNSVIYEYNEMNECVKKIDVKENEYSTSTETTTYVNNKETEFVFLKKLKEYDYELRSYKMTCSYDKFGNPSEVYYVSEDITLKYLYNYQYNENNQPVKTHKTFYVDNEKAEEDITECQYDSYGNMVLMNNYFIKDGKKTEEEFEEYIFEYYK